MSPEPDSSTRNHPGNDASAHESDTSSSSHGSEPKGLTANLERQLLHASFIVHSLATDDVGRAYGLYLISDTEASEIAEAGSHLISRKIPKGLGNRDVEDYARIGLAVASYVGRQFSIWKQARSARRQMASATSVHDGSENAA